MPQFDTHFLSSLVFWSLVSFAVLLFLLYRYAFPVLLKGLEDREKKIREDLENAERGRQEAQSLLAEYQEKLKSAHKEAHQILDLSRKEAQKQMDENAERMKQEGQRILGQARNEIEREKQQALQDVRTVAMDLSLLAAEKILARKITDADHARLVDEAIREIADKSKG